MSVNADGWFDWATRHPGPPDKLWDDINTNEAVFFHSAVGSAQGVIDVVDGPTSNNRSVTGVVHYDGTLTQFYPVTASPWANGSHDWNRRALGIETEGGGYHPDGSPNYSEPETEKQIATQVRILTDLAAFKNVGVDYWQRPTTLKEHCEVYATACPSHRIPWNEILRRLQQMPDDPNRDWLFGNEAAGEEVVGNQIFIWHRGIVINKVGDEAGDFPGKRLHNEGGTFVEKEP